LAVNDAVEFSGEPEVYHAAGLNDAWTIGRLAERHD
jgi:hypothetical protein